MAADDNTREPLDPWLALQRVVAVGMVANFLVIMLVLLRAPMPPLVVAGTVFATLLGASWWRPRVAAIAIGVLSALWLIAQVVNATQVLPDLADPSAVGSFTTTVAMIVVPAAGTLGLVGLLWGLDGRIARWALIGAGTLIAAAVLSGAIARSFTDQGEAVITDGSARVAVEDNVFAPDKLRVPAGTRVTWDWGESRLDHDVVSEDFSSQVKATGTFAHTFDRPGVHPYECTLHPGMTGVVTVVDDTSSGAG